MLTLQHYHWDAATWFAFPGGAKWTTAGHELSRVYSEHYDSDIRLLKADVLWFQPTIYPKSSVLPTAPQRLN